jgi:hypothetical protein
MTSTHSNRHSPESSLVALARSAVSDVPEVGLPSMTLFVEVFRSKVARNVAPLHAGLRPPLLTAEAYTEHALAAVAAQLHACAAETDAALHAWVSAETTRTVLETHAELRRAVRARRAGAVSAARTRAA